jgi:hypothetical protein
MTLTARALKRMTGHAGALVQHREARMSAGLE